MRTLGLEIAVPKTIRALAAAIAVLALPTASVAQDVQVPNVQESVDEDSAFTMVPAEGRHLKIDRRTGRVSICSEETGTWSCRLVADDRLAYEEEIERLQDENQRLQSRIDDLEEDLVAQAGDDNWIGPEDEKKIEEFLTFSDKAFRRFFGMVQDLKRDLEQPDSL